MKKELHTLASIIRNKRLILKLSQKKLAEKIKVSPQFINDIEHGRRSSSNVLKTFSKVLDINID